MKNEWTTEYPKEPPVENEHRPGVAACVRCAWCGKVTNRLIRWTAQGADGFYHAAVVCRECYDKAIAGKQDKQQYEVCDGCDSRFAVNSLTEDYSHGSLNFCPKCRQQQDGDCWVDRDGIVFHAGGCIGDKCQLGPGSVVF